MQLGDGRPPVHRPPDHRTTQRVVVGDGRKHQVGAVAATREALFALEQGPPVVQPGCADRSHVDLLVFGLADVGHVQQPAVEPESPRVAEAVRPHLACPALPVGERVVGRDCVRRCGVHVEAKQRGQQRLGPLSVVEAVIGRSSVAQRHVEVAVRPERQHAAVVVARRLRDVQQLGDGLRRRGVAPARSVVLHDAGVAGAVRVVHEQPAVLCEVGVEGDSEQPLFEAGGADLGRDVEEVRQLAVPEDADDSFLLGKEHPVVAGQRRHRQHQADSGCQPLGVETLQRAGGERGRNAGRRRGRRGARPERRWAAGVRRCVAAGRG